MRYNDEAPIIEEVQEEDQTVYEIPPVQNNNNAPIIIEASSDPEENPKTDQSPNQKDENPYAVVLAGEQKPEPSQKSLFSRLRNTERKEDDSSHSFADHFVPTVGSPEFSAPEPSAPPMTEEEVREYEAWGRAQSLRMRLVFPQHQKWQEQLRAGAFAKQGINPAIQLEELPRDEISTQFLQDVINSENQDGEAFSCLRGQGGALPSYSEMQGYLPVGAEPESSEFDEVRNMMNISEDSSKQSYVKSMIAGTEVPPNTFIVLTDKGGKGNRFQIWGPGFRKSLAGTTEGQSLGFVQAGAPYIPVETDYYHVSNRFTIIRIQQNELGFVLSRREGTKILKLSPGRYFILENEFAYIGKATLRQSQEAIPVEPHSQSKETGFLKKLATQIKIINTPLQHVAFVCDTKRTYALPYREEPYILDERRGEFFLNFGSINEKVARAKDQSYSIVNRLLPGEYILFVYQANEYVWRYSEKDPHLNTPHLPGCFFKFDGLVHHNQESRVDATSLTLISLKPAQTLVIKDERQNIRFLERGGQDPIVLRKPWQALDIIATSQTLYQQGRIEDGQNVSRAVLKNNEWALVISREGGLQLLPPLLEGPQYFRQPEQTLHAIVDKTKEGEQVFVLPGLGKVSIVNLISGTIGACRFRNINFFIGPQIDPYVFVPPNQYIKTIDVKETLTSAGDLHRIYLKPGERAVIDCDGKLLELPTETPSQDLENLGNGIYVFRARNLNLKGPSAKGARQAKLTPIEYINVGVGEVGYGYVHGTFKIWGPGEHKIDNRKEEYFSDFFSTSVDPVEIRGFKITSKHTITSHIDIFVSYRIADPRKALESFSNREKTPHQAIHEYIASTTTSEVLDICSTRPPIGYTDLDFDTGARKKTVEKPTNRNESEGVEGIESSFAEHVQVLFEQHGIELSKMRITKWEIDPEFSAKCRENAIRLQDERSKNETEKILLERQKIESEKKLIEKDNEANLRQKETAARLLELDASKKESVLRAQQEAEVAAAKQVAEAKAKAEMAKANAAAKLEEERGRLQIEQEVAESARLVAEKAIETETLKQKLKTIERDAGRQNTLFDVETEVQKQTAHAIAQAKAEALIAESQLSSTEASAKAAKVKTDTKKYEGLADAEVEKAKALAKNPDLSAEQRVELQKTQLQLETTRLLVEGLVKSGISLPGIVSLNPEVLKILGMQSMTQTTSTGPVTTITSQNPAAANSLFAALAPPENSAKNNAVRNDNNESKASSL